MTPTIFSKQTREGGFLCLFRSKENRLTFPQTGHTTLCSATQRPVTQKPSTYLLYNYISIRATFNKFNTKSRFKYIVTAFKAILRNHDKCSVANAWFDCMSFQMRSLPSAFQIVQMLEILRANIIICSKTWTIIREKEEMETIIVSPAMTD